MSRPFNPPPNSQRLFDLITFKNPKFKMAFYFALRNTLVCPNIDIANNLALGANRHRVVTLDGKIIEESGVFSGGGKPRKGGMSTKIVEEVSPEMISQLQYELGQNKAELEKIAERKYRLEQQLYEVLKDEKEAQREKKKSNMELLDKKEQIVENQRKISQYENVSKARSKDEEKISRLQSSIFEKQQEKKEVEKKVSDYEEKIKGIEMKIVETGGTELIQTQEKVLIVFEKKNIFKI